MTRRVKRRRADSKLRVEHVRAAWKLYQAGMSTADLGRELWQRFGYASPQQATLAIQRAFWKEGYKLRSGSVVARARAERLGSAHFASIQKHDRQRRLPTGRFA